MLRVALVPLDDRPCHTRFPQRLAELAGVELLMPPRELLGRFLTPGQPTAVLEWLETAAYEADASAVCMDMAVYGGLVASRQPATSEDDALTRVTRVSLTLRSAPGPSAIGSVIMRGTITVGSAADSQTYQDLARYSVLAALPRRKRPPEEWRALLDRLPEGRLADYHAVRRRNHSVNRACVQPVGCGLIGYVAFAQEDCRPVGLHRQEQEDLLSLCRQTLSGRGDYDLHPGADELSCVLLARMIVRLRKAVPKLRTRILPQVSAKRVAPFEDRPVHETLAGQLRVVGARETHDPCAPLLLVAGPLPEPVDITGDDYRGSSPSHLAAGEGRGGRGGEAGSPAQAGTPVPPGTPAGRDAGATRGVWDAAPPTSVEAEVVAAIRAEAGPVALADVRVANGAYLPLAGRLRDEGLLDRLCVYGAWNTAGNTLGTTIAFLAVATALGKLDSPVLRSFLLERRLDDIVYQSVVRRELEEWLRGRGQDPNNLGSDDREAQECLARVLVPRAEHAGWVPAGLEWSVTLPWSRTFECDVELLSEP
jgi:hypothetical protein